MLNSLANLIRRCLALALPYGRRRLLVVLGFILLNGVIQVVGVTSVFPFFALAAEPDRIRNSQIGTWLLSKLPPLETNELLVWSGLFSIAALILSNAAALAGEVIRQRYGHGLGHFLRMRMLTSLASRPYSYFLGNNSGKLLKRILSDVSFFTNGVLIPLMEAVSRLITITLLILTIFFVHPGIALTAGVLLGAFYLGIFLFLRRKSRDLGQGINRANEGTIIAAQQFLGGIKPAIIHGKEDHFVKCFEEPSASQARLYPWVPIFSNSPRYLIEPIAYGGLVAAIVYMAARGSSFADILPNLSVMALAGYRLLPSLQLLYAQFNQITATNYTISELETELNHLKKIVSKSTSQQEAPIVNFEREIQVQNLTFHYPGADAPVIENLSLSIPKLGSVGIIGPTGSGKSTLVDTLLGLHRPQNGQILIDEQELSEENIPAWRTLIGYVPQDIYLTDCTIAENIAFGLPPEQIDHAQVKKAAEAAQLCEFVETQLPERWDTVVGERGVRLSGGQRQRIGLARALYLEPQVLVLDEATSALDVDTEAEVMKAIDSLRGKLTMIVIAHRLSTIEGCDQVIELGQKPQKSRNNQLVGRLRD